MPIVRRCDHLALKARNLDRSIEFYRAYLGMEIIHDRREHEHRVVWMRLPNDPDGLVLVIIENPTFTAQGAWPVDHLGVHVDTRADVDAVARRAEGMGILVSPPQYAGAVVGYFCCVGDPDGNVIEFSCEQLRV